MVTMQVHDFYLVLPKIGAKLRPQQQVFMSLMLKFPKFSSLDPTTVTPGIC
ncbi:unnamed protein product [Lupinus luteus]|uniref:Uncharacterized protein n=1 Tax=Lupinus luteus TaxID=3873 RepID=A0AAV1X9A0_LUPLU